MSVKNDPALYSSDFERLENERYFTESWVTRALIRRLPDYVKTGMIWEPAAGRGDILRVLHKDADTADLWATDIDMSEFDYDLCDGREMDFLRLPISFDVQEQFSAIITNPPYGKEDDSTVPLSERFVRHALEYGVDYVAMLLRSEFNSAKSRADLFEDPLLHFAYEIVLTSRPRWDWWYEKSKDEPNASPRHNFSWFVWDAQWKGPSTQFWEGK